MPDLRKAYAISDAKISFVSLVDKAANKREFLITKAADNGTAEFTSAGKILKSDKAQHSVTGVVYEPMTEDSHRNYMTAEEVEKAAHWFAKNGTGIDLQHNFKSLDGAAVLESYIAPSDLEIGGKPVKKGSWVMTVEVDNDTYDKVEKRLITGLSMGGVGNYSNVDVELEPVEKSDGVLDNIINSFVGLISDKIKKSAVSEKYAKSAKSQNFYTAFEILKDTLYRYDADLERYVYETDADKISTALSDFNDIVNDIMAMGDITKALEAADKPDIVYKAGAKMSAKNLTSLKEIQTKISELISSVDTNKEEDEMSKDDVVKAVNEAMEPVLKSLNDITKNLNAGGEPKSQSETTLTSAEVAEIVAKAVEPIAEKVEQIAKAKGLPNNLGDDNGEIKKEAHYMSNIFGF